MNAKRNIIECIFEINTDKLEINKIKIENFYNFISEIVKNSHFLLKLSYKLIIYQLLLIDFLLLILFYFSSHWLPISSHYYLSNN